MQAKKNKMRLKKHLLWEAAAEKAEKVEELLGHIRILVW